MYHVISRYYVQEVLPNQICSSSFHKNMHSLKSVNKRRHFNNTTLLSWYATLFIEILILNTERRNQKSIHGKEWMEMIWTLYCLRHSSVLGVLNEMHAFQMHVFHVNVKIWIQCKRKRIVFSSSLEEPIKFFITQTDRISCIWINVYAQLGKNQISEICIESNRKDHFTIFLFSFFFLSGIPEDILG